MEKNIVKDGLITSPINHVWTPQEMEGGSFYNQMVNTVRRNIEDNGDWTFLHNQLNGDQMKASEFETLSKKFAVFYRDTLNLGKGDAIHLIVGNHNFTYPALGGIWILGGVPSLGDVGLDEKSIASQLKDTNAKLVICVDETWKRARNAIELVDNKKIHLYSFDSKNKDQVENILEKLADIEEHYAPDPVEVKSTKRETCIIFWSSGTTGMPKGICHSHCGAFHFLGFAKTMSQSNINVMTTTCFFHVGGFFTGINALEKRQTFNHVS